MTDNPRPCPITGCEMTADNPPDVFCSVHRAAINVISAEYDQRHATGPHDRSLRAISMIAANVDDDTEGMNALWPANPREVIEVIEGLVVVASTMTQTAAREVGVPTNHLIESYRALVLRGAGGTA